MSAAPELTAAADTLESLARAAEQDLATADYWKGYNPATAWRDGLTNGMGGTSGDLAGALPPGAVLELARWLRAEARQESYSLAEFGHRSASPHAVALARAINGSQP
jgi:hypothetical protein